MDPGFVVYNPILSNPKLDFFNILSIVAEDIFRSLTLTLSLSLNEVK